MNEKLLIYERELSVKEQTIQELKEELENYSGMYREQTSYLENLANINQHLILNMPDLTHIQAFIKEINEHNEELTFLIDYAKWEHNSDAPNNANLVNEKEENIKIRVNKNVETYTIENATPTYKTLEDFITEKHEDRLYNLYFIENKLVLIIEQLLP
ncbi:hypothetical protein [Bacillus oleivorans]|nr:hypothetical protein [Bacillus oleivorans]